MLGIGGVGIVGWHRLMPDGRPIVVGLGAASSGEDEVDVDDPIDAAASVPAGRVVAPPPLCSGVRQPDDVATGAAALADVDGAGCSAVLRLAGGVLTMPTGRFALGEEGDRLVAGDWDGDGRWSPALHRPSTGEVFLFDDTPSDDGSLLGIPAEQLPSGVDAAVVAHPDGHHTVVASP